KQWALDREIPVFQPEKLDEATVAHVQECQPCLVLVMAYGHILRRRLIDAPALGTFNLHASILPKYRGASPIEAAIASGDEETGVTLTRMVRRLDAGPIVDIERFPIDRLETGESAARKISEACPPLLERNLPAMLRGEVSVREQDDAAATFTRKLEKIDGALDFAASAEELARHINAL